MQIYKIRRQFLFFACKFILSHRFYKRRDAKTQLINKIRHAGFAIRRNVKMWQNVGAYRIRPKTSTWISRCIQGVCDTPLQLIGKMRIFLKFKQVLNK